MVGGSGSEGREAVVSTCIVFDAEGGILELGFRFMNRSHTIQ